MTTQLLDRAAIRDVAAGEISPAMPVVGGWSRPAGVSPRSRVLSSEHVTGSGCSGPRAAYRMSRWQRLSMTLVVAGAVVVGLVTALSGPPVAVGKVVTARAGDTVGSIVLREMPTVDPLRATELTQLLNGLSDGYVAAGASVRLPDLP